MTGILETGMRYSSSPELPFITCDTESMADCGIHTPNPETRSDDATYNCTYHECTLRFETPADLQQHKQDDHRNPTSRDGTGTTSEAQRNSQVGPHKVRTSSSISLRSKTDLNLNQCERINPSTGKPCDTIFSRPYDLTRHEDTIHNTRKQKVICHSCLGGKSFSRNDALIRHIRKVHPEERQKKSKGDRN